MAGNFKNRTQSTNKNTQDQVGAQFVYIDGSAPLVTVDPATVGARLIKATINTKGLGLIIRSGSRDIATIGTAVAEQTLHYGVYCENGIQVDVSGSGGNVTLVYANE